MISPRITIIIFTVPKTVMKSVFVDTAVLIVLGNRRDDVHRPAQTVRRTPINGGSGFVTTRWVIVELGNAFSGSPMDRGGIRS